MCTIGKTDIRSTYKFDDSYCQPKLFPNNIMIIIGLHADNKPWQYPDNKKIRTFIVSLFFDPFGARLWDSFQYVDIL